MSGTTQIWNRLEPRPRAHSFKRAVRAEVRDALWMISRQWQLGELNADDTGTAAFARLDMQTSRINRIAKKQDAYVPIDESIPLECLVEREPVVPDLLHRIELGRQFMKMLRKNLEVITPTLSAAVIDAALDNLRNTTLLQFVAPATPNTLAHPEFYSSPELLQATLAIGSGRAVDGYEIIKKLKASVSLSTVITFSASTPAKVNALLVAGSDFLAWYNSVYSQPGAPGTEDYWLQNHLEYQFACSAPRSGSGYTVLSAREYYQGHLDWYSFNIQDQNPLLSSLVNGSPVKEVIENKPFTVIPSKINFGGMPAPRYWEMEDRRIDIGNIRASTTDTATLLVGEFAMLYSNDWTLLPYTVPTGSICNLRKVLVTDVFGQVTYIGSGCDSDWNMFTLTTEGSAVCDPRLFIPPVLQNMEESEKLESVTLMRDEMANMVWAVETIVPNGVSGGQSGKEAAQRLTAFLEAETPVVPQVSQVSNSAKIKYNMMTHVPENWIPYTPVNRGTLTGVPSIQLQRAAMPRQVLNNPPSGRVRPRTSLLEAGSYKIVPPATTPAWHASYIHEEEVPRSGAILSMTWQRARWHHGQVALWLGRRKQNGRGEGNSGLRFDYLTEK